MTPAGVEPQLERKSLCWEEEQSAATLQASAAVLVGTSTAFFGGGQAACGVLSVLFCVGSPIEGCLLQV